MPGDGAIPIIDVFAGPGGLGEGFSCLNVDGKQPFRIALSIEKDPVAHQTLELRAFFRQFKPGQAPGEYYEHLRGNVSRMELFAMFPNEADSACHEAWRAELGNVQQFPDDEVDRRIRTALRRHRNDNRQWVLIGGPPCQAYSLIGRARMGQSHIDKDARTVLYKHYLRIIAQHKPTVFVMENVKGLLSATRQGVGMFERILEDLQHAGSDSKRTYDVFPIVQPIDGAELWEDQQNADRFIIKAEEFGIPQARHRLIVLGVRRTLHANRVWLTRRPSRVTVKDVIDDLPPIRSTLSREPDSYDQWCRYIHQTPGTLDGLRDPHLRTVMAQTAGARVLNPGGEFVPSCRKPRKLAEWYVDDHLGGVCNHSARGHIAADVQRYFFAACFASAHDRSPTLKEFPIPLRPLHSNVNGDYSEWIFTDRFRVQLGDAPANTITSHISKDGHYYIHYDPRQCRSLTVREAARLQTFPDNYFFCGPRTDQYRQVGNAVPPLLARQIADAVYRLLHAPRTTARNANGQVIQRA